MLSKYNTLPHLYPVSQPFISRFSVHAVDVYESPGDAPANGYDDLKRPAYTASGRRFFSRRLSNPLLSNPLLARKNDIAPSSSGNLQRPSVTHGSETHGSAA